MVTRNQLEQRVPDPDSKRLRYWKHFMVGGITGVFTTTMIFPLDTLKKRLQLSEGKDLKLATEVRSLIAEGGIRRFYSGMGIKLTMNFTQGALFNAIFVMCTKLIDGRSLHDHD